MRPGVRDVGQDTSLIVFHVAVAADDESVSWDSASSVPTLSRVGEVSVTGFGPLTGLVPDAAGPAGEWISPQRRSRSVGDDAWATSGADVQGLPSGVSVGAAGGLSVGGGLEWMQARVYDGGSRSFLSTDPLAPVTGSAWAGNPYSFAGDDPVNRSDPWGLSPVTEADLQAYRDNNNGSLHNAASAAKSWVGDNWEYIAGGAMIVAGVALMFTGVGGPAGIALMAGSGALMSAGASTVIQKHQNGSVDWKQVGVDGAIGAVAGAAGGGAGAAALRTAGKAGANGIVRTAAAGMAGGAADGGVAAGLTYAASGQPLTPGGLLKATAGGATVGGLTGGATVVAGKLTKVSRSACFIAGTQVLMGDGTSKAIEDIGVGDEVQAADVASGTTFAKPVVETYVHKDIETWTVETSAGEVTSTAEHPFYVIGKGWTPVRELSAGEKLVNEANQGVEVISATPTGDTAHVYNVHVQDLNNYYVGCDLQSWVRVHNDCSAPAIGYAEGLGRTALTPNRLQHGTANLTKAGVLPAWSGKTSPGIIERAFTPILESPAATFGHMLGETRVQGFLGEINGQQVAAFVYREGPYQGQLASSYIPSANQLNMWGMK